MLKECQQRGIEVALENPCFDLWLLLHQADIDPATPLTCKDVERMFREAVGQFNKKLLRPEHYPPEKVVEAVRRAKALDVEPGKWFPANPCSRIYRIVEQAVEKDFVRLDLGV